MLQKNALDQGSIDIELFDEFGNLKETQEIKNVVVNNGLNYIASRMKDASATAMSHMAIGSDNTAAAAGNTALGTELGRVALDFYYCHFKFSRLCWGLPRWYWYRCSC